MSARHNNRRGLSRREFLGLSAGLGAGAGSAWLLGACAPAAPAATPTAAANLMAETKHLINGTYNPNWANNVLVELADAQGWFKEEGIESREIVIIDQGQIIPALIGGSLMTAQQDTDAIAAANLAGEPVFFISTYRDKEPWIFGVAKGINSAEDLKGKQVSGGQLGSRNENNGKEMLRRLGLDPEKDVEWVPVGGGSDGRVQGVIGGVIAGTVMQDRHMKLIEDAGGKILYNERESVPQDCYCAHRSWLDKNERTAIGFIKATFKAREYVLDLSRKDEIIEFMKSRGYEFPEAFVLGYEDLLAIMSPTGTFTVDTMVKLIQDAVKAGTLEKEVDWHTFVDLKYQNQAFKELGRDDLVMNV
ncbi:MAG TPA: ABC transporter substrate-binding protein [Anaerolineae bacterium]|nr:ABC transporter substrate-binding protein [Anaerolineae bacterium]